MRVLLLMVLTCFICGLSLSQLKVPKFDYGDFTSSNLKLRELLTIKRYGFIFWKKGRNFMVRNKKEFSSSDLGSTEDLLCSFINCNNSNWFHKLYTTNDYRYDLTTFFRNKASLKSKNAKLLSKFEFIFEGSNYSILTIRTNALNGENQILSFLLKQINKNQWKISLEQPLSGLTSYFFLKPEITQSILLGNYTKKYPQKYSDYFNAFLNNYNVLLEDGHLGMNILGVINKLNNFSELENMLIPNDNDFFIKKDIKVFDKFSNEASGSGDVGVEVNYSVRSAYQYVNLYKYNTSLASSDLNFSSWYSKMENIKKYDSIPEVALVSWLFNSTAKERSEKTIGIENFDREMDLYDSIEQTLKRIEWSKYKLVFQHDSSTYVYLQFSEWSCNSNVDYTDGCNENWLADKSILMKWNEDEWKIVLDLNHELMPFIRELERLNYEGAKLLISGDWMKLSPSNETYQFFSKKSINSFSENRVHLNRLGNSSFVPIYIDRSVPKKYRSGLGIRGIFDRGRVDDLLPYWMDRER